MAPTRKPRGGGRGDATLEPVPEDEEMEAPPPPPPEVTQSQDDPPPPPPDDDDDSGSSDDDERSLVVKDEERTPWTVESGDIKTQNCICSVNLKIPIDCRKLAMSTRNSEYNPKKFSAVIMRIRDPRTTALVFQSGKMVVTGARTPELLHRAARKFGAIIKRVGFAPRFDGFAVQNVVATCDTKFQIRLEALVYAHAKFASYEPELFPGLVYRMLTPKCVFLVFVSGRIVLTGGKSMDAHRAAFEKFWPVLCEFKKETAPQPRCAVRALPPSQQALPTSRQALPASQQALPAPPPLQPAAAPAGFVPPPPRVVPR